MDPEKLTITIYGPDVQDGKIAISDLADIIKLTQDAVIQIGRVLMGSPSKTKGRVPKNIEQACRLMFVGWQKGSGIALIERDVAIDEEQLIKHGSECLHTFVEGMDELASGEDFNMPKGFDKGVIETCEEIGRKINHGIENISYSSTNGRWSGRFLYDAALHKKIKTIKESAEDLGILTLYGRLEMLNGHGNDLIGNLYPAEGSVWRCKFKSEHLAVLKNAWMDSVTASGHGYREKSTEGILLVDRISIVQPLSADKGTQDETISFWEQASIEDLIHRQGVVPISNLDEVSDLWPADDNPNELMKYFEEEREQSKRLQKKGL